MSLAGRFRAGRAGSVCRSAVDGGQSVFQLLPLVGLRRLSPLLVSIVIPCRNEVAHLAEFLTSVFGQQLPAGATLEVIVADGFSDDGSREALVAWQGREPRLKVIDNPGRIVSAGLNVALKLAEGELIARMDVHTEYAPDYVAQCLAVLAETGADNVGGPWRAVPDADAGAMQHAIAAAFQSRWVAGGARSRQLDYDGWVDTVYLGCWPRASFERFGGFDEALVRNQDDEHNLRIAKGGGRIWQSPRIRSVYRPRAGLAQVFRQYLQYGYWKPFVVTKHGQPAALRHLAPGLFIAALAVAAVTAPLVAAWPLALLVGLYVLGVLAMTLAVAASQRPSWPVLLRIPAVIAAYHFGYGIGSLFGGWDALRGRPGRERFARLTR